MECETMLFVTKHIPYLWGFSNSFFNSLIDFYSCKVVSLTASGNMRKNEAQGGGWFEALNWFHVISCEIFAFGDALHETKRAQTNFREWAVRTVNHLWDRKKQAKKQRLSYHFDKPTDSQRKRHLRNFFACTNWSDLSVIIIKEVCSNMVFPWSVCCTWRTYKRPQWGRLTRQRETRKISFTDVIFTWSLFYPTTNVSNCSNKLSVLGRCS